MSRNDDYTTGNLLDFWYHQSYYKPIDLNLSRQTNANISQQTNFTENVFTGATMLFLATIT